MRGHACSQCGKFEKDHDTNARHGLAPSWIIASGGMGAGWEFCGWRCVAVFADQMATVQEREKSEVV